MRPGRPPLPRLVVWLGAVSLLTDVHSETILAVLPVFVAETLGAGAVGVGLLEGLGDLVGALVRIAAGSRSDRTGRRKPLAVLGYALSTAAKTAWSGAGGIASALAIRTADRVGKGLRSAPRDALIADAVPPERRGAAFGLHRAMDTAGAVLGSLLAAGLLALGLAERSVMAVAAVPGVLAVVLLAVVVREPARDGAPRAATARAVAAPTAVPVRLVPLLVAVGIFSMAQASYAFFLLRARDLGAAVAALPLLYLLYNAVYAALPWFLGRAADRWGRRRVLAGGYLAFALAAGLASLARDVDATLLAALAAFGASAAVVESVPRAIVAEALGPDRRGTALGWFWGVQGVAAVAGGLLYGGLWDVVGSPALFAAGAAAAVVAAALLPLSRAAT